MRKSVQRGGFGLVGILLIVAGLAALSARTGGPVSWHITAGGSMQPGIQPGTLVVVARKAAYAVGDVVAYPAAQLNGQVVLHRVVDLGEQGRLVLQGDANSWLDADTPLPSEALGSRVLQVDGIGRVLAWLTQPAGMGLLAALVALPLLDRARRRRRRSGPPGGYPRNGSGLPGLPAAGPTWSDDDLEPSRTAVAAATAFRLPTSGPTWDPDLDLEPSPPRPAPIGEPAAVATSAPAASRPTPWDQLLALPRALVVPRGLAVPRQVETGVAVLAGACVLLVAAGTAGPLLRSTSPSAPAQHVVTWAYGAKVAPGLVYDDGRVETGDTLYTRLVDAAKVTAELRVDVPDGTTVEGTWRLDVAVSDDSGWKRTTSTGKATPVRAVIGDGKSPRLAVDVQFRDLLALARRAAEESGAEANGRRISVRAVLALQATTDGRGTPVQASPELVFVADEDKLRLAEDSLLEQHGDIALPATDTSEVVQLAGIALPADATRATAGLGALLALAALGLLRLARREEDEDARITRSAGQLLVPMDDLQEPERTVDVSSFEALAAIAASYDRMVLYGDHDGLRVYLVLDDGIAYRYFNADAAARLEAAQAGPVSGTPEVVAAAAAPADVPPTSSAWVPSQRADPSKRSPR